MKSSEIYTRIASYWRNSDEKQIKAIDERYWPFAVPVEEVAEG